MEGVFKEQKLVYFDWGTGQVWENKGKQGRRDVWEQIMGELVYAAEESRLYIVGKEACQGFWAET